MVLEHKNEREKRSNASLTGAIHSQIKSDQAGNQPIDAKVFEYYPVKIMCVESLYL